MLYIRNTLLSDLDEVLKIYESARRFMKDNSNPNQWGDNWPNKEIIIEDIEKNKSFVVIDSLTNKIVGVYAFIIGEDPTYKYIKDGKLKNEKEYGTIHRLASSFSYHGIFSFVMGYLKKEHNCDFRIDTHKDNKVMIKAILKEDYEFCGIIYPIEGGERLAYHLVRK